MNMKQKAFTLIELLLAVSILSLAASIVLAQVKVAQGKARDTVRAQQARQIDNAIQLYIQEYGHPPYLSGNGSTCAAQSQVEALYSVSACFAISTSAVETEEGKAWSRLSAELSPYLKTLPNDPCPSCESASGLPIGYTYVPPLYLYDQCVQTNGAENCSASQFNQYYQVYAPLERNSTPAGNSSDDDPGDDDFATLPTVDYTLSINANGVIINVSYDSFEEECDNVCDYSIPRNTNVTLIADLNPPTTGTISWGPPPCSGSALSCSFIMDEDIVTGASVLPNEEGPDIIAPSIPQNATAILTGPEGRKSVEFSWDPSTDTGGSGMAGYTMYINGVMDGHIIPETTTDHTFGTIYWSEQRICLSVVAYDAAGNISAQSDESCVDVPYYNPYDLTTPTGLSATPITGGYRLSWNPSTGPEWATNIKYNFSNPGGIQFPYWNVVYTNSVDVNWAAPFCWRVRASDDDSGMYSDVSAQSCVGQ